MSKKYNANIIEYIESGDYFKDARTWYYEKYLTPITHRSIILFISSIIICVSLCLILNLYVLFPIDYKIFYMISTSVNIFKQNGTIIKSDAFQNKDLLSIADVLVNNYIMQREKYSYDDLKKQFYFVQKNSTRLVYKQYLNYMNLNNAQSPVLRYQKYSKRYIKIINSYYDKDDNIIVNFASQGIDGIGNVFENLSWQAKVSFNIDDININALGGTKFNFSVTEYELKLLNN